jgi:hypothetical protein
MKRGVAWSGRRNHKGTKGNIPYGEEEFITEVRSRLLQSKESLTDIIRSLGSTHKAVRKYLPVEYLILKGLARSREDILTGKLGIKRLGRRLRVSDIGMYTRYPDLVELCREIRVKNKKESTEGVLARIILEEDYNSIEQVSRDTGMSRTLINKIIGRYHGIGEKNQFGLKSAI